MKRLLPALLLLLYLGLSVPIARAGEGMWIPLLLASIEDSMQARGLKLSAEDIYSVNKSSLKDAVLRFGGGCTGELVSAEGLLITNYHCGRSTIRDRSTMEANYIRDGFWAMNRGEEIVNPGLTATFIIRIEDVTAAVLADVTEGMSEVARAAAIARARVGIEERATEGTHYEADVVPFYYGNAYYLIVKEVFRDVRLVGAPPSSIGEFGGETDNWVWPRHTGDFSLFRIYMAPDGSPADYSSDNVPFKSRHFFPISMKGVEQGDFTMVFGFPGQTEEYLPSYGVQSVMEVENPISIRLRAQRLAIMEAAMRESEAVNLQYIAKASGVANAYKKWKGQMTGLVRNHTLDSKRAEEAEFRARIAAQPAWQAAYGGLFPAFEREYAALRPDLMAMQYFFEGGYAVEVVPFVARISRAATGWEAATPAERQTLLEDMRKQGKRFFDTYHAPIDRDVLALVLESMHRELPDSLQPILVKTLATRYGGNFDAYSREFFATSAFTDSSRYAALLAQFSLAQVQTDPAYVLMYGMYNYYFGHQPRFEARRGTIDSLQRVYMQALRTVFPERTFYPDANSTLRLTYGKVEGMRPMDAVSYRYYTTLDGAMDKYKPGDFEFDLPERLVDLHRNRDYGPYAHHTGELRVAFIASNHTSGGNSGSPVIDGEGHLIGVNFDRNWEGTMSDIDYDPRFCRNIGLDIRYVLFIIDKYAGAGYLLDEMKLVGMNR
ncbi:MAG: S46 family peptidase [Bacteroidia bacterium]